MWSMIVLCCATIVIAIVSLILTYSLNLKKTSSNNFTNIPAETLSDLNNNESNQCINGLYIIISGAATFLIGKYLWKLKLDIPAQFLKLVGSLLLLAGCIMVIVSYTKLFNRGDINFIIYVTGFDGIPRPEYIGLDSAKYGLTAMMYITCGLALTTAVMYLLHLARK